MINLCEFDCFNLVDTLTRTLPHDTAHRACNRRRHVKFLSSDCVRVSLWHHADSVMSDNKAERAAIYAADSTLNIVASSFTLGTAQQSAGAISCQRTLSGSLT